MTKLKIAFGYKMGVGKDEAVSYLTRKFGGKKVSFADPLYKIMSYAQLVCGFPVKKDRKFLQFVGTDWAREQDPDVWVNIAMKGLDTTKNLYISDLRFPNEFRKLKQNNWKCVKIVREHNKEREGSGNNLHTSEKLLDMVEDESWDYIIENNGCLEEFYQKLDNLVADIRNSL